MDLNAYEWPIVLKTQLNIEQGKVIEFAAQNRKIEIFSLFD